MRKLVIKNFGPISSLEMHLKNFNVLIGQQATGKSTAAKLDFFLHVLPRIMVIALLKAFKEDKDDYKARINIACSQFLNNLFRGFTLKDDLFVEYTFSVLESGKFQSITIKKKHGKKGVNHITLKLSEELWSHIETIAKGVFSLLKNEDIQKNINEQLLMVINEQSTRDLFIKKLNSEFFGFSSVAILIPAARSRYTDPEFINKNGDSRLSLDENFFGVLIELLQNNYSRGIEHAEQAYRQLQECKAPEDVCNYAKELVNSILKGEIQSVHKIMHIAYEGGHTPLIGASSGQQEAIWMLLVIFDLIIKKQDAGIFLEEPEGHLYPVAQYALIKLLSVFINSNKQNGIFVTTHSPYILSAINNMIVAGRKGQTHPEEVNAILPKWCWLTSDQVSAYELDENGRSHDIFSYEQDMIQTEYIDEASRIMNKDFDTIDEIGVEHHGC